MVYQGFREAIKVKKWYIVILTCPHFFVSKKLQNCLQGIPRIPGIQDIPSIPSIPGLLEIVKFG